ncbi:hypothetical protein LCGC14_0146390 [marine sediment metagenome]|uniref:Uncharacterized protein n=1 Tax=marine sediment metagenome TaxID=412755 RepID=A0A0F9Y1G4_9ZZZZ
MTFILVLGDMRSAKYENSFTPIAISDNPDKLRQWVNSEKVDKYTDGRFRKVFKQGGPLEWYNPPDDLGVDPENSIRPLSPLDEYIEVAVKETTNWYNTLVNRLITV